MDEMIKELLERGLTKEEIIAIYVAQLGFTESAAREVYAIETGEIDGDLIEVDENAN
jgi:hypothetical protein